MALDGIAPGHVHRNANGLARFGRPPVGQHRAMDVSRTLLLRVQHPQSADLAPVVSGHVNHARVADLAAHFGVAGRAIENEVELVGLLPGQDSFHHRLRFQIVKADEFRGRLGLELGQFDDLFFWAARARSRCSSMSLLKPATSTVNPRSRAINSVRSRGKPCSS